MVALTTKVINRPMVNEHRGVPAAPTESFAQSRQKFDPIGSRRCRLPVLGDPFGASLAHPFVEVLWLREPGDGDHATDPLRTSQRGQKWSWSGSAARRASWIASR